LTLSGAANFATTSDASGNYSFASLSNGSYTVTPSSQTATFSPTAVPVTVSNSNVSGVNFAATATSNVLFFDDFTGSVLSPAWTVISRHGEYAQDETECNTPQQVSVANSLLTITSAIGPGTCGDFNIDGSIRHSPASWPYITGDIQWQSFNFTYGTVTVRAKFPDQGTGLWPAVWMLGSNCQNTNPLTADVGYDTCPNTNSNSYVEFDVAECFSTTWCQANIFANAGSQPCSYAVDANYHVFGLTWTPTQILVTKDGVTQCSYNAGNLGGAVPSTPVFLIIQTQTGGIAGTPSNATLPATFNVDFVKVTRP
jgi:hypothetical protein